MPSALTTPPVFDEAHIAALLGNAAPRFLVEAVAECESTNTTLLKSAQMGAPSGSVLVAERQTAGRGRRGRNWYATPDSSLTFSLLWRFPPARPLNGLTLALGVALAQTLGPEVQLKWPNDLLIDGKKLGGVLLELADARSAVIGIGINLALPNNLPAEVAANSAALPTALSRPSLLANLLGQLLPTLEQFAATGFAPFQAAWQARHAFQQQSVRLLGESIAERTGFCLGVDSEGALLFDAGNGVEHIFSGDISLRQP